MARMTRMPVNRPPAGVLPPLDIFTAVLEIEAEVMMELKKRKF